VSSTVRLEETFGRNDRKAFFADGRRIITLVTETEVFEPSFDFFGISKCPLSTNGSFDYGKSIANEVL